MEFFVNNNKLDITLENEKTIGDVLRSFEEECAKNNATTIKVIINGKTMRAEDFDSVGSQEINDSTKLELTVISQDDISENFRNIKLRCQEIAPSLQEISVKLQTGKDKEANALIAQLADLLDNFCHTASLSSLFPDKFKELLIDGKSFSDFFADFTQILNDFEQAIASKDTVLIGDLSEYEISPRLLAIADAIKE